MYSCWMMLRGSVVFRRLGARASSAGGFQTPTCATRLAAHAPNRAVCNADANISSKFLP